MDKWFSHEDPTRFLFLNDLLLAPLFILLLFLFANAYVKKQQKPIYKKYFLKALGIKIFSAVLMALVYQYYYNGGGDTHTYFTYAQRLRTVFDDNIFAFLKLVFLPPDDRFLVTQYFEVGSDFFLNESSNIIIRLALILSYPLCNTYLLISFIFTLFCFYGCWKIFVLFHQLYPHLEKEFALACLFLPSVCFLGELVS